MLLDLVCAAPLRVRSFAQTTRKTRTWKKNRNTQDFSM
jgi:hypothetical protein